MQKNKLKPGYKMTEIGVIPEDWEVKTLNTICDVRDGTHDSPKYQKKGIKFITSKNIINGKLDFSEISYITQEDAFEINKRSKVDKNDILMSMIGTIGNAVLIKKNPDFCIKNVALIKDIKKINTSYLIKLISSTIFKKYVNNNIDGGIQKFVSLGTLRNLLIQVPKPEEQKEIAQVLSDTDKLINLLDELIEKKEKIKEGTMQELLTGKRRLPGFSGEWEEKKLGEICNISKGQLITSDTCIKGNIPVIAGGKQPAYYHNQANRKANTITISASGANAGYVKFHNYPIFASDCSTIEDSKNYSIYFIYNYLQLLQNIIYKSQTGGAQPHIHPSDLNPIEIYIPTDINEQKAIADVLSDMDNEIENLKEKREKYKQIKEGMMQELLTGKIRLV